MKSENTISYSGDIVRSVAKELCIPEEKVKHVLEFLIYYLKELASLPDVFSICIPEMGQMYLSAGYLKNLIINLGNKNRTESENQKLEQAQLKLESMDSLLAPGYSPHKKRSKIRNNYFSLGKSLKELESLQNEYNGRN